MVQRKVPNKLGIEADHIKSEKRLGSLKPSSCQHQDGKNKGIDLKKKMKKSRSIKLSDIEGLRSSSSSLRKTIAQPGKPPPLNVQAAAATPQKKSMIKAIDGSPNYMKSTSSSEAKKESSRNTQTGSCNKPARTLTRTSSLKLVRTLTKLISFNQSPHQKSPTFKPVRASAKKCSRVALCTDMNEQRATCSSTLKDSKFPAYLMLNPGGTESEGTSIIKVCTYTYCSLNGHHHTPLPPLKCFLKARRRSIKTQRSMKMEALSPRRRKPSGDGSGTEEFDEEQVVFGNEPPSDGVDLVNSPMSPLMQGGPMEFFIEIYAKSKGNDGEATRGSTRMGAAEGMDDSRCDNEIAPEHETNKPVSLNSEIEFDENLEHCGKIISKVDIREILREELKHKDGDEEFRGILVKEESSPMNFTDGDKQESISSVDMDHNTMFEAIDMEWEEEWPFSASEPGDEAHSSMESDDESHFSIGDSSESDRNNLCDKFVISSDESNSNITEEILADVAEQVFEEENTETDLIGIVTITPSSGEELTSGKEKMLANGVSGTVNEVSDLLQVPENSCTIDLKDEAFESTEQFQLQSFDELEQDETNDLCPEKELPSGEEGDKMEVGKVVDTELLIGIHDSSHVLPGADEDDNEVEDNQNNQLCEVNNAIDESFSTSHKPRSKFSFTRSNAKEQLPDNLANKKWTIGCKRHEEICEKSRKFNPQEPNFLPVVPDPDAEKVDLRHQMMDERKNAEEWMLDHALQQAVTKLAPARNRKVALLVEAFETVLPISKGETHLRHTSTGFSHGRPIQTCN